MKRNFHGKPSRGPEKKPGDKVRLNKYISNAGVCSRRDADKLIQEGKVKVNGQIVTELGHQINPGDEVRVSGKVVKAEEHVYILLNKPRGFITTTKDEKDRDTVMDLIKGASRERVYPVGRLDRNTSGVLLLTNDGELTNALIHPSNKVPKVYSAKLNKHLAKGDFIKIMEGIELEDGFVDVDDLAYADPKDKSVVGIQIHSGKNRVIRRLFESLGYEVEKLDRVMFSILTKKDLPRGKWRYLSAKEVRILKSHFHQSVDGGKAENS
jgi:23S rRNA pseudouridine2605 synthase